MILQKIQFKICPAGTKKPRKKCTVFLAFKFNSKRSAFNFFALRSLRKAGSGCVVIFFAHTQQRGVYKCGKYMEKVVIGHADAA